MAFEQNMKKLEKIVDELHSESLSLEKAIEKFEEGVKIAHSCMKSLEAMKKRVELVTKSKDGKIKIKAFNPE